MGKIKEIDLELRKKVNEDIEYYIEESKEYNEDDESIDNHCVYIPFQTPLYFEMRDRKAIKEIEEYCNNYNKILIEEMSKRGYKHLWCDEDIEFYKEKLEEYGQAFDRMFQ